MMTTTAAFGCQSKPNHITMIGATPIIGRALTMFPTGIKPVSGMATCRQGSRAEPDTTSEHIARKDGFHEGLHEVRPKDRQ